MEGESVMGMVSCRNCTSADEVRAAALAAAAMRKRGNTPPPKPKPRPIEETEPAIVYQMVRPVLPKGPIQHNAHVNDWYRHECARLGKQVSELEFKLGAYNDSSGQRVYVDEIIAKMCDHYSVSKLEIKSDRRTRAVVLVRQKMMWVAKKMTPLSYPQIGRHFGGRDHTTVLHGVNKIDRLIASNDPSVSDLKGWAND